MEEQRKKRQENVVAGVVGAFLGTLLGVVCTVVIGQLGYVASLSGLIMAVGALKGYELLGGRLSKKGAVISSALILVMTWLAHRLTWAIALTSAVGLGVFDSFQAIPELLEAGLLEGPAYWGDLVMLYLFTLLGAVPTIIGGLRSADLPDLPQGTASAQGGELPGLTLYPGSVAWMRPLRLSAAGAMFVGLVPGIALLLAGFANGAPLTFTLAAMGCIAASFVMMFFALPSIQLCYRSMNLMVRSGSTVWRVTLPMLNNADTYRFTKRTGAFRAIRWEILTEQEQEQLKVSVQRAVALLSSGQVMPGSALSAAVMPLPNLRIYKETRWLWKGTYSGRDGKEKKVAIPKAYEGFSPAQELEAVLFRDVLSTTTTNVSGTSVRKGNVKLAGQAVNGTVLNHGDVFDYNKVVGKRTTERGYGEAATYVNGETVNTVGGGICQVSSTIYLATLLANLEIVERYNHRFYPGYITLGMDATVSWGGPEFRFKNNTGYPIRIDVGYANSKLTVTIVGTKTDDTYVKMTYDLLGTTKYETEYVETEELPWGEQRQKQNGYTGYEVISYRNVYKGDGTLLSSNVEAKSNYKSRNQIILSGTAGRPVTPEMPDFGEPAVGDAGIPVPPPMPDSEQPAPPPAQEEPAPPPLDTDVPGWLLH